MNTAESSPPQHQREPPSPVLASTLPPSASILEEGALASVQEFARQSRELQRERELAEALLEDQRVTETKKVRDSHGTWTRLVAGKTRAKPGDARRMSVTSGKEETKPFDITPNAYELYAAIDRKDLPFIMRVRDHAFPLLLQKNAGEFPIVYASRIGKSHKDIAIIIVGALSRYVNHLAEEDFQKRETLNILRMLRINLKLAIDAALLPTSDSSLLSSYLQVLIMSEGDAFLHKTIHEITLTLRATETDPGARPVSEAERIVKVFCTKELKAFQGFREGQLGVQQYIANATMDLVIMAEWRLVADLLGLDPLPTYTFARDQRTFTLFAEAIDKNRALIQSKVHGKLKRQIEMTRTICEDTRMSIHDRVEKLKDALDFGR